MKKWVKKLLLVIALVIVVYIAFMAWLIGNASCIVRVSPYGWNRLVYLFDEFYAVQEYDAMEVPLWLVFLMRPKTMVSQEYVNQEMQEWVAILQYDDDGEFTEENLYEGLDYPWLESDFGDAYRLYYHRSAGTTDTITDADLQILHDAAHTLHSGRIDDVASYGGGTRELAYLYLLREGDNVLLVYYHAGTRDLYSIGDDGSFHKLLTEPEYGQFSHYYFP